MPLASRVTAPPLSSRLNRGDLLAEPEHEPERPQVVLQRLDQLVVDEVQDPRPLLDERDVHAERGGHRGVLEPDHAAADHRQRPRQLGQVEDPVGVEHGALVELDSGRARRRGADGDDDALGGQPEARAGARDLERVRVGERRRALEHAHAVAAQLVGDHVLLVLDHLVRAREQVVDRDLVLHAEGVAVDARRAAGQLDDRGAQRLRRHRAGVGRHPAERRAALDQRHALAELRRLDGRALPGRAGADRDQIEVAGGELVHRAS